MASVRLSQLIGRSGTGSAVRLVSLIGRTVSAGTNKVRLTSLTGRSAAVVPVVIDAGADRTLDPMEWVEITAGASEFVVWSITQTAGPHQQLLGEGSTWRYRTPGTLTGAVLEFTVTGTSVANGNSELATFLSTLATSDTAAVRAVFLGSSTTVGNNASTAANRYVNRLSAQIRVDEGAGGATLALDNSPAPTTPGFHVRNGGISATSSANYVPATTHAQLVTFRPQICFHMIGSNDYGISMDPAVYKANVEATLSAIDTEIPGLVQHVLINSYQRMDTTGSFAFALYGQKLAEIAAGRSNVQYLDLNPYYIAQGVPGADPNNLIDVDNLHQTDAGHAFMATTLHALIFTPSTVGVGSDSVVHTIRAHGGAWSPAAGTTIRPRGLTRYDDLVIT